MLAVVNDQKSPNISRIRRYSRKVSFVPNSFLKLQFIDSFLIRDQNFSIQHLVRKKTYIMFSQSDIHVAVFDFPSRFFCRNLLYTTRHQRC